ncbi:MAG: Kiwa anti-phage protein KwaB-like domain-containing protein, partial [Nitrospiraceae bacterium]
SWAYVIEIRQDHKAVYGFRKINSLTQAKKVHSLSSYIFRGQLLVDVDEEKIFTIDPHIDFFVYEGTVFITSKKGFESALNFRKGMEDNRDIVLEDFKIAGFFTDVEPIRKMVGSNLHLLRKMSAIQKSGYYKDKAFIESLIKINAAEDWGLLIKDGKIVINDENVELVLTLLNNSRLKSPINHEVFDAQVKKKVG